MRFSINNACKLLNAVPSLFVLACLPDYLFALCQSWGNGIILIIFYLIVKSFLYAGIYGTLTELASGEEYFVSFRNLLNNAQQFFFFNFLLSFAVFSGSVLIAAFFPDSIIFSAYNLTAFLEIVIIVLLTTRIIKKKYRHSTKISFPFPGGLYLAMVMVYVSMSILMAGKNILLIPLLNLLAKYINLLIFICIAGNSLERLPDVKKEFDPPDEIFLINPTYAGVLAGIVSLYYPFYPPFFVVLKALSPKKYKFREFNTVIWNERYFQKGKLVAITCFTSNCALAYEIAQGFRKKGSTVIMGGPHVTYLPDEALNYCDSVVIGEAEGVWENIVKDYENGTLKKKYYGSTNEAAFAKVHQYLLQSPPYVVKDFIETTRGCKFKCGFCSIPSLTEGRLRTKPVSEILELLKIVRTKFRSINFLENNIYSDPAYAKELFQALKPLKISWSSFCTIDIAKNDEILALAKESGCKTLYIGYEIPGDSPEKSAGGKLAMAQKYAQFTRKIKAAGIQIRANFIFGFDSDSWKNLREIWKFSLRILPTFSVISCLTPFPGTKLYDEITGENRIKNMNWYYYNAFNLVFRHPHLDCAAVSRIFAPFITFLFLMTSSRTGLNLSFLLLIGLILFTL